MHTEIIIVKYVNQPKSEKGPGSVKDSNGNYWKVWPDLLAKMQPDHEYTILYTKDDYQGKEQRTIKSIIVGSDPQMPFRASQKPTGGVSAFGGSGDAKSEDMACMSLCGRYTGGLAAGGAPYPAYDELVRMFRNTRLAWREALKAPDPKTDLAGELDDEIPGF